MPPRIRLLLLCLWLPSLAAATETLTLGILAYRAKPATEEQFRMLGVYLTGALPDHQVAIEILDPTEMETALDAGRLDFIFTNPGHFVLLRHHNRLSGAIATLQSNEDGQAVATLGGAILAPSGRDDIKGLADLAGKRIATPGYRFLGGYQAQAHELLQAGIRLPQDAHPIEVGDHDKVIERLLAGDVDAGFVRTGIIETLTHEGKLPAGRLKLINPQHFPDFPYAVSTRLYPEWAFAALPHVPEKIVKRVARALLFIEPDMPVAEALGIAGFAIPGDYQAVEQVARALRLPPYETPEFRGTDVWQRYRWTILAGLGAAALIALLSMRLFLGNRRLRQEQNKLAISKRRLNLIVEAADLGTWYWHLPSGKVGFNRRLTDMLGYAPDELAPHASALEQLIHPADQVMVKAALDAHLAGQTPRYVCTHRLQHKDGHWIWVLDAGQITERDADGATRYLRGIHLDITEAKEAEAALRQREQHLHTLLGSMDDVVMVFDTAGRIADCHWPATDAAAPDTTGWCGRECGEILPPALADTIGEIMGELILDAGKPLHREFAWPLTDRARWFSATFSALKNADEPYPRGFLCVARDITLRKDEEMALALSRAEIERLSRRNQLLLDAAGEGIYGVNQDGRIDFINPSALAMLGLTEAEALGQNSHELFHDRHLNGEIYPVENCPLHQTLLDGQRREVDDVFLRRNGTPFFVHLVATPVIDEGRQVGVEVVFLDISARKAMEAELTRLATTDMLTGVANRRQFMTQAETELARIRRFDQPAAVLMLDLDHFKRINDTHGHAAGDAVLKAFADLLRDGLRKMDCIGRLGGEEFAVLLPGTGIDAAVTFAERLRRATVVHTVTVGERAIVVTVSIGIAMMHAADTTPDEALARADAALYRAKAEGRNRVYAEETAAGPT